MKPIRILISVIWVLLLIALPQVLFAEEGSVDESNTAIGVPAIDGVISKGEYRDQISAAGGEMLFKPNYKETGVL